ncbi:myb transcription [Pyrenophora seminiperda CCB06]|uniref:Myb transcription n=1 Tax=Pyrenophora seminiperda CCB06 TaxID=1302712 RepID=A0A3M7M6R5_9PLEO|nr:myb transcription [Pyrenophora seminiperda CCB06]
MQFDGEVKDWIADCLPGRTNKDCRKRWHNSVAGGVKKGQWSSSEDRLLVQGVEQHGQSSECAKRWQQSLDPNLDRSEWRDGDDANLISAVQRLGRHWKDIQSEHFPGRSKNDIKNRYTVLIRRYQNQGITLPNVPSSPSDSGTPAFSNYPDDDDYTSFNPRIYDTILPSSSQITERRSWSGFNHDAYPPYAMPTAIANQNTHHSSGALSPYAYAQPPPLASNMPSDWNGAPHYMQHPSPLLHSGTPTNPSVYGHSAYSVAQQPPMSRDLAYTASTAQTPYAMIPNRSPAPRSSQHGHQPNTMANTSDPRHPHYPFYHS